MDGIEEVELPDLRALARAAVAGGAGAMGAYRAARDRARDELDALLGEVSSGRADALAWPGAPGSCRLATRSPREPGAFQVTAFSRGRPARHLTAQGAAEILALEGAPGTVAVVRRFDGRAETALAIEYGMDVGALAPAHWRKGGAPMGDARYRTELSDYTLNELAELEHLQERLFGWYAEKDGEIMAASYDHMVPGGVVRTDDWGSYIPADEWESILGSQDGETVWYLFANGVLDNGSLTRPDPDVSAPDVLSAIAAGDMEYAGEAARESVESSRAVCFYTEFGLDDFEPGELAEYAAEEPRFAAYMEEVFGAPKAPGPAKKPKPKLGR